MKYLPDTDRDKVGDVRPRIWLPFAFGTAFCGGLIDAAMDSGLVAWLFALAACVAVYACALLLTRRRAPRAVQPPSPGEQP